MDNDIGSLVGKSRIEAESKTFDLLRRFNRVLAPAVVRLGFLNGVRLLVREGETRLWIRPFSLDWFVLKEIFERNIYAAEIKRGDLVLDIGAHIGLFSIYAATLGARVLAFEPDPRNLEVFRDNLAMNGFSKEVSVTQAAVWTERGFKEMYFTRNAGNNSFYSFGSWVHLAEVRCVSFNEILDGIDGDVQVVKMDIEGTEYDIIREADLSRVRQICLEYHTHSGLEARVPSLLAKLKDQGFKVTILGCYPMNGYLYARR